MDYHGSVQRAVAYIELHLKDKIALGEVAARANLSVSHLYRVFPAFAGCTIGQYIRRRRMTEAAGLLRSNARILDIALEYRFESQESFSRAFKAMFGVTPGEYRRHPTTLPLHTPAPPGRGTGAAAQPAVTARRFRLIGLEAAMDLESDFSGPAAELAERAKHRLTAVQGLAAPARTINMWYPQFDSDAATREPAAMLFTGAELKAPAAGTGDLIVKDFPESLYAVFEESRRGTMGGADGYAYQTWLPASGYALNEGIPGDFEEYPDTAHTGYEDPCRIWIPICRE